MGWGWGWGGFQHRCLLLCSGPLRRARPLGVARPKTPQKKSMLSAPAAFSLSLSLSLSLLPFFFIGSALLALSARNDSAGTRGPPAIGRCHGTWWALGRPPSPPPPPGLCLRTQSGVRGGGTTWPSRSQCQHWTLDIDLERGEPGPVREEETLSRHKGQAKYIYEIKERPNWLVSPPSSPHPPPLRTRKKMREKKPPLAPLCVDLAGLFRSRTGRKRCPVGANDCGRGADGGVGWEGSLGGWVGGGELSMGEGRVRG